MRSPIAHRPRRPREWGTVLAATMAVVTLLEGIATASAQRYESATERYRGIPVRDVVLVYEGAMIPEAARALVDLVSGDAYRPEAVRRSIRQLFALGVFSDVKVEAERVGDQVDVLFRLYPRIDVQSVRVEGLANASDALRGLEGRLVEESRVRPGDPLDVDALQPAATRIERVLHDEGYLWAKVEPEASFQSPSAIVLFHVDPGRPAQVGSIEVFGVDDHVSAHVLRELGVHEGSLYSRDAIDESLEEISTAWRERGYYAASIEAGVIPVPPARVDVRIEADLGPQVRIEVRGYDYPDDVIRELVPLYDESRYTADLVEEARANLEGYLLERGYRDASVVVETESLAEGRYLYLRFITEPGRSFEVAHIEIEGLESLPESQVRQLFTTRTRRRFPSAPFRRRIWESDLQTARAFLRRQGFHRASVTGREMMAVDGSPRLTLVAHVAEGPRAILESVELEGASQIDSETVLRISGLVPGSAFDPALVVDARERIMTHYVDEGFRQVRVRAQTTLNDAGTEANVEIVVSEGLRTRVDRVIISGLVVTRESSVRELVTFSTGEPLSPIDILETRQKLVGSGLFRNVNIEVLPADPVTNRSDVLISLREGPRTTFGYGFGFEERQLGRAELEVTRRNLFGLNRTVSLFTRLSFRGGRFITTYRQPNSIVRGLPLFVSVFAEEEERTSFDYNRVGVGLQISKRVGEEQNLFFRYRFDRTKVFDLRGVNLIDIDRRFRPVRIGALSIASVTDQRDDPLSPASGQFRILDVEWSAEGLGTEAPYIKGLAQQFLYQRLPHGMVAAVGLRFGVAHSSREPFDELGNPASLPINERFFAGGANTLRGFALDEASPKRNVVAVDESGEPILVDGQPLIVAGDPVGGNVISLVNLELRFPIWGNLQGVAFSDNGNVYRDLSVARLLDWRHNLGFGARFDTPLGPLRVDYGFKLDRRTFRSLDCPDVTTPCAEPFGRWHVSLGHAF